MRASTSCLFCGRRLDVDYVHDPDGTVRRIGQASCDNCSRCRIRAAQEFIRAADAVRLLASLGIEPSESLLNRARDAEHFATSWNVLRARRPAPPARFLEPREKARHAC